MTKEVKEFKVTCTACGDVRFFPFYDFEANKSSTVKTVGKGTALTTITSVACLPLGCCMAADTANNAVNSKLPVEQRIKNFCKANNCPKCNSQAISIETITHNV